MDYVIYDGKKYKVDKYNRLILSGLDIKDISQIEGLDKLERVESLSLYVNSISDIKGLENLIELKALFLYNNEIKEIKNLDNLKNLQKLILNNNKIEKIEGLTHLTNLRELNLRNNKIQKIEGFNPLKSLEHLDLRDNHIKELEGLSSLASLRVLFLDNNEISELKGLDELNNLHKIFLDNNNISEIKGLENLDNLVYIRMKSNPIPEELQKKFCLEEGVYDAPSLVKYCRKKVREALIEEEKAKGEPEVEDETVKMNEFKSIFKVLKKEWKRFIEQDTYLTYEKKAYFLRRLREISQFPWYYPIRYYFTYKKVKKKKREFKKKINEFNEAFVERRLTEYLEFFDGKKYGIEYPLDPDQREAIIRDDKHNLVVAGAGSGKTSVLTSRIAYLVKRSDKVNKDKILALAFTRVAAQEMEHRLLSTYNIDINISTFHALGRQIIKKELNLTPDLVLKEKKIIQQLFETLIENEDFQELFLDYLLYHNEEEINEKSFEDKQLYYDYQYSMK